MRRVHCLQPQAPVPDVHWYRDGQRPLAHVDRVGHLLRGVVIAGLVGHVEQRRTGHMGVEHDHEVPGERVAGGIADLDVEDTGAVHVEERRVGAGSLFGLG